MTLSPVVNVPQQVGAAETVLPMAKNIICLDALRDERPENIQ